MKYKNSLKLILTRTIPHWDREEIRPSVREVFDKAMRCRTTELGAEVYCSENQELILYHTCKSRACPSCGYRANVQWLRERWAALPDALYKGITFTMPDLLWPFFRDNPSLAKALPALAAEVIRVRVGMRHGLRVGVIAILHTFNGQLEFNSHVHTMATGGGLYGFSDTWVSRVYCDRDPLMKSWRKAVIALLRAALRAGQLHTKLTVDQMEEMLTQQEKRWWSIKIQSFEDKSHFLQYAGRYVRGHPSRSVVSPGSGNEPSGTGSKTKSSIAEFTCSAHWKSSLIVGPNTSRNTISTPFGALGCLLRALSGKPRQPSGSAPSSAPRKL